MTRRALVIGSQTYGLKGCDGDVALMEAALAARGFDPIDVRTGEEASRAGLVDGFTTLIAATAPEDAVVIYYSGHGGRNARTDFQTQEVAGGSAFYQYIVPFDMEQSDEGDFRGLLSEELTAFQQQLTEVFLRAGATPNITTVLDCCHSGYMARGEEDAPLPKAISNDQARRFSIRGIRTQLDALTREAPSWGEDTNPHAVRVVACQIEQSAFERESARGGRHGVLTDCLVQVLDEIGDRRFSWAVIGDLLRQRVQSLVPDQRPAIEGPATRLAFSTTSTFRRGSLPVSRQGDRLTIEAAGLLGIEPGDTFQLEPADEERTIADAVVAAVVAGTAELGVELSEGIDAVPLGARAIPKRVHRPRRRVAVKVPGPTGRLLTEALAGSARLTPADGADPVFATVVEDDGLVVLDHAGARMRIVAATTDEAGAKQTVDLLEVLSLGQRLGEMESGAGESALETPVAISFATIEAGRRTEQPRYGTRLRTGAKVSLRLTNLGEEPVLFWLFDIGVSGRVSLVTNGSPAGQRLTGQGTPGATFTIWGEDGGAMGWPSDVPSAAPAPGASPDRPETFVLILADRRQDLADLQTPKGTSRGGGFDSELDRTMEEVRTGTREAPSTGPDAGPALRYRIERIQFLLQPPS